VMGSALSQALRTPVKSSGGSSGAKLSLRCRAGVGVAGSSHTGGPSGSGGAAGLGGPTSGGGVTGTAEFMRSGVR
jgi:hypothetical protein